jgi:hypothetical protein
VANGARTESVALGPRERGTVLTAPPLMSNMGEPFDPVLVTQWRERSSIVL